MGMRAERIFETVVYADDLDAAERFYRDVLGLAVLDRGQVAVALRCGPGVLLVFDRARARATGRGVPAHGTQGAGHLAFLAAADRLDAWREHLGRCGVPIEQEVDWPEGGTSVYFRDPAGNSVELAPPELWGGGWAREGR